MRAPEAELRRKLREVSAAWPRYGHRRAWALLRQEGWNVNRKRVQRLWREEGLRVPTHQPKRRRLGSSTVPADRLTASSPNEVWAMDFMFDTTSDGRPFKVLTMCDEFTRESIGGALDRSITAAEVVRILQETVARRGAPAFIRCDNGPEFTAATIRDWCSFSRTGTSFIEPGSPWQNPYVESFNGKSRDELSAREVFDTIWEARVLYDDWREVYNHHRPHSSLSYRPPAVFAASLTDRWGPVISVSIHLRAECSRYRVRPPL